MVRCLGLPAAVLLCACSLCGPGLASGQERATRTLAVGTREAPPFSIKSGDGTWHGISIELWRDVAAELGLGYEFQERSIRGLLDGLQDGSLDAAVAALTVTASREELVDFTHPFYTSGLGIAVTGKGGSAWLTLLRGLVSSDFLKVLATLVLVLLVAGALVWLFERRRNPKQFGSKGIRGLGASFWWSAVTMTTVGYGDKAPKTVGGRVVALIWMFTSVIIISGFTAAIASSLTVNRLRSPIQGPEELFKVRVATVSESTSETYLQDRAIRFKRYGSATEALEVLVGGSVDAVVYDAPILRYLALTAIEDVLVLPRTFERQDYAIALPEGSPLRNPINLVVLRKIEEPGWEEALLRYLGR